MTHSSDTICIDQLPLTLSLTSDDADNEKDHSQTVLLSLIITHDISKAARLDDLTYSIDYATVYATLVETLPEICHVSLETFVDRVFETLFCSHPEVDKARVVVTLRDAMPRFTIETTRRRDQTSTESNQFTIGGLSILTIAGVNLQEHIKKQPVTFDITVSRQQQSPMLRGRFPFVSLSTSIHQTFAASAHLTLEALSSSVACHVLEYTKDPDDEVTIKLSRESFLAPAASTQIQLTRRRDDFADVLSVHELEKPLPSLPTYVPPGIKNSSSLSLHSAALGFGSNLGDRFANIETALCLLELPTTMLNDLPEDTRISVIDTSFMYETAPMYVTDQPRFANCACMIETNLSPLQLLRLVKEIETAVGRVPSVRFGPRAIDVDILMYDDQLVDTRTADNRASLDNLTDELVIPHPRMCEREYVLRPLDDMIPHVVHPACNKTIQTLLDELISTQTGNDSSMLKVMPFPKYPLDTTEQNKIHGTRVPPTARYWAMSSTDPAKHGRPCKTRLMATLNMTPDSFSDSGQHNTIPAAIAYTTDAVVSGADIIDIGGCSTRPYAELVSTDEELRRVLPVIRAIRAHSNDAVRSALLSIDTFHPDVALQAVLAGVNCINDVYSFTGRVFPPDATSAEHLTRMRGVARRLCVPVVLTHSRGDAGANKDYSAYSDKGGIVSAIQIELGRKVDAIVRGPGGVRRWLVFVDPGFGLSKPVDDQLVLMRDLARVTTYEGGNALAGYPLLVGPSRKMAFAAVLEWPDVEGTYKGRKTSPQERGWATAAAVACSVQQGVSVVRVHDVAEMRDVVAVASAIWNR